METTKELQNIVEIKKALMLTKAMATFDGYSNGNLYYKVELHGIVYRFPMSTTEPVVYSISIKENDNVIQEIKVNSVKNSSDLGITTFMSIIRGSELIRWISKAYNAGEFVKISYNN